MESSAAIPGVQHRDRFGHEVCVQGVAHTSGRQALSSSMCATWPVAWTPVVGGAQPHAPASAPRRNPRWRAQASLAPSPRRPAAEAAVRGAVVFECQLVARQLPLSPCGRGRARAAERRGRMRGRAKVSRRRRRDPSSFPCFRTEPSPLPHKEKKLKRLLIPAAFRQTGPGRAGRSRRPVDPCPRAAAAAGAPHPPPQATSRPPSSTSPGWPAPGWPAPGSTRDSSASDPQRAAAGRRLEPGAGMRRQAADVGVQHRGGTRPVDPRLRRPDLPGVGDARRGPGASLPQCWP